jgi:hypothetical protein
MRSKDTWIIGVARIGFAAKGIMFICMGLLSALAAFQGNGEATDSRDAIKTIAQQPFGRILLVVLIAGLACHVLWRLLEAVTATRKKGLEAESVLSRIRSLLAGIIYGGMTVAAIRTLMGASAEKGSDDSARSWTAALMSTAYGPWLVSVLGVGIVAYGIYQWFRIYQGGFEKKLRLAKLPAGPRRWIVRICAWGISARGLVFCLIGVFLIQAGLQSNPSEARGLSGALSSLRDQPYGVLVFAVAALGLAAYGVYCGVKARYSSFGNTG